MKSLKIILIAACFLFFLCAPSLSEGFFARSDEIIFADECPDGYQAIAEKLILGEGEMRVIANEAKYFASHNHDVVSVDNNGILHAVQSGRTTVCVYFDDNIRKDLLVEVTNAPKSIKLTETKGTLEIGDTHPLKATLTKSTTTTITWSSSVPDIVSVDENGVLTALCVGECTITARTHNGLTAECAVTVKMPAPAKIDLFTDEITLYLGETASVLYALEGGYLETIDWTVSNPSVATVDETGAVTALGIGQTTVCMEASGGDIRFIDIIVKEGSTSVSFPASELTLYVGGRDVFEPIIEGGSGKYEYVSMDPSIAGIDPETGEICALRAGSVYILAVTPNFTFGEFLLTIVEGPEKLTLIPDRNEITLGEVILTSNNLDGFEPQFTWYESTDNDIAHVDEYGVVTGMGKGTAVISVHSAGLVAETEITVLPPAKGIKAWASRDKLGAGESTESFYTLIDGTGVVEYASSDVYVAQADGETGTIYALSPGSCEITLTVSSGVSASFPITVYPAPENVLIEKSSYTLASGNRLPFSFSINEGALTTYTVFSSDPELVWYEDGFLYCGEKTGTATITVQTHNHLSATCSVTVIPEPAEITVSAKKLSLNPHFDYYVILPQGATHALDAFVSSVPGIEIAFSASHPDIADVNKNGLITTGKKGTSLITVSLRSGLETRVLVSVQ